MKKWSVKWKKWLNGEKKLVKWKNWLNRKIS